MKYVDALKKILKEATGVGIGDRWIRDWLILNKLNSASNVPMNAPFTQVTAMRILLEYPYESICQVLQEDHLVNFAPYVAISDTRPCDVLIIDMTSSLCVAAFKHKPWEFRWKTLKLLETWMRETAADIMKRPLIGGAYGQPDRRDSRSKGAS